MRVQVLIGAHGVEPFLAAGVVVVVGPVQASLNRDWVREAVVLHCN